MKRLLISRSTSRAVRVADGGDGVEQEYQKDGATTSLTVWRKSLLLSCNGFTVINSDGNLVYRVDNYMNDRREEFVLMDGSGEPLFTLRRQKLWLVDNWLVFEGDVHDSSPKKPIWYVRKHINLLHANSNVLAHVFLGSSNKRSAYTIEGSYRQRSCQVLDKSRRVVAEIKRKEAMIGGISFGVDVFLLIVRPGFDSSFAMALILLLDQMFS